MDIIKISNDYTAYFNYFINNDWNSTLEFFRDSTVNQSWEFNLSKSSQCSTVILKKNNQIVSAAILRIKTIKNLNIGIAYLGSGPLWRLKDKDDDINSLRQMLVALKCYFVQNKKLFLRIAPNIYSIDPMYDYLNDLFQEQLGYKFSKNLDRTLFLNLAASEEELRKGLHQKWRNLLNRGEKVGFSVKIGSTYELFKKFKNLYGEMVARKGYPGALNIDSIEKIQNLLPSNLKYTVVLCELDGQPMSGGVFSTIGDTAVYFLGATSFEGKRNSASYVLQWETIKWLKNNDFKMYDLGGCSPETVPETYHFKAGICGKNPIIHQRIGILEACENPISKLTYYIGLRMRKYPILLKKLQRW